MASREAIMNQPLLVRRNTANYDLFTLGDIARAEDAPVTFRDVTCNDFELVPGGSFAPQTHDDKLEIVTPVPLGQTVGPVVRYSAPDGSYALELDAYDSIVISRHIPHQAESICDTHVILIITNFDYVEED
jgi:hypothetical protein